MIQNSDPIAVVGLACWYPEASNPGLLWENILSRRRQFRQLPDCRLPLKDYFHSDPEKPDKTYAKEAALIDGFDFDWASRRIPYSTYLSADITHWLSLEVSIKAIEDAGYSTTSIPGEHTGVIVGNSLAGEQSRANTMRLRWPYVRRSFSAAAKENGLSSHNIQEIKTSFEKIYKSVFPKTNEDSLAGGLSNTIPGRICNFLDLHGGGYVVDGACSSSLIAIATSASKLASRELDLALAGGVDISLDSFELIGFSKTRALTDNEMNVYDRKADGFIPGEGCAFVVLKRLQDARRDNDYIYALVQGWGISSDGSGTGITAPNAKGQSRAIKKTYELAPYTIKDLLFIEGHGTGTSLGDRTELEAISLALGKNEESQFSENINRCCGVTSLKSIIGHTKAASGIGSFIKAVCAVNRRILPPTAGCDEPQPVFNTRAKALYPIMQGQELDEHAQIRAGVSSMGFGGINCHVTLESGDPPSPKLAPVLEEKTLLASSQRTEIFVFTANSQKDLLHKVQETQKMAQGMSYAEMTDLAAKLGSEVENRARIRSALLAERPAELCEQLLKLKDLIKTNSLKDDLLFDPLQMIFFSNNLNAKRVGLLFPGQGSQKLNMAGMLVKRFKWARELVQEADAWIEDAGGQPVGELIYRPLDKALNSQELENWFALLSNTEQAQPAICLCSLLWLHFLEELGVYPHALGGHSLGELTAFYAAGAYSSEELIKLATVRGQAMAASGEQPGAMLTLFCDPQKAKQIQNQVPGYLVLANINSPNQVVLSGEKEAIKQANDVCAQEGIKTYPLKVSNAFHSKLASKASEVLKSKSSLEKSLETTKARLFSSTTGKEVPKGLELGQHFSDQVLAQVDFISMLNSMSKVCDIFVETGPGRALSGLVQDITGPQGPHCLPVESKPCQDKDLNTLLAALFVYGVDLKWDNLYKNRLVRPFKPAQEKLFIDNPCERPFDLQTISSEQTVDAPEGELSLLTRITGLPGYELTNYLQSRAPFLADVIKSDIKHSAHWKETEKLEKLSQEPSITKEQSQKADLAEKGKTDIRSLLFSLVEQMTGFAQESLTPDLRLLDDLNLDSIKAGDIIAKAAREAGFDGDMESLDLANASLSEVISIFENPTDTRISTRDIYSSLLEQATRISGYPQETFEQGLLLGQDLRVSRKKLQQIIQNTAEELGVNASLDLKPLMKRSLKQIADIFKRIAREQKPAPYAKDPLEPDSWVREFSTELVEEPFEAYQQASFNMRQEDKWENCNALLLATSYEEGLLEAFRNAFLKQGANVSTVFFQDFKEDKIELTNFTHILAIFPMQAEEFGSARQKLLATVKRLSTFTALPSASESPRRRTNLAFIQFGGGFFGKGISSPGFEQCSAHSFAASIHLERTDLRIRVLDYSPVIHEDLIAEKTIQEISTPAPFAALGFDHELRRRTMQHKLLEPASHAPRKLSWSCQDIILVTGGAKGIAASCALELSAQSGACMALVGRSPHPQEDPSHASSREIAQTLNKFKDKGVKAIYLSCDVSDRQSVLSLVQEVKEKLGPITGVIHGAGLNHPKPLDKTTSQTAFQEVSPKILGALNILEALQDNQLKIFCALTSIIGVTGMPGNAWYAFSNEALNLVLKSYQAKYNYSALCIAYSIWRDEGMGTRLGSVTQLKRMGIDAIPTQEGVKRFVHLFLNNPGPQQVIVTARLQGLDTWNPEYLPEPENLRFLEEKIDQTPGVESAFKSRLQLDKDPYLKDHYFNGSYLFPTVFGLEAMAQTVRHVLGTSLPQRLKIRDIKLKRPITVDPKNGTDILIRALKLEKAPEWSGTIIQASITKAETQSGSDHFSASFILEPQSKTTPKFSIPLSEHTLALDPQLDLYKQNLLFQGPLFQRIQDVRSIEYSEENKLTTVFASLLMNNNSAAKEAFPETKDQSLLLGDPFFRDSLLQSALLLVPEKTCLPVFIREMDINTAPESAKTSDTLSIPCMTSRSSLEKDKIQYEVTSITDSGGLLERLEGYEVQVLKDNIGFPSALDLANPEERDLKILKEELARFSDLFNLDAFDISLKYLPGIHKLTKKERHELEQPLIQELLSLAFESSETEPLSLEVKWLESGRPRVKNQEEHGISISIAHDERLCIGVAGEGTQGCDIAPVAERSREQWQALVGKSWVDLLDQLIDDSDSLDIAGTRIWAALEVCRKIEAFSDSGLDITARQQKAVLFKLKESRENVQILTLPLRLTWGPEKVIALAVRSRAEKEDQASDISGYESLFNLEHIGMSLDGPQGQGVFYQCFHVGFRPSARLSRNVYFSNYCFWLGEVREASVWPVLKVLGDDFASGKFGQVTNDTHLYILGEATVKDRIEVKLWTSGNRGPTNSTMELTYDFRKILPDGSYERVAKCTQNTTWVEVLGHGVVKPQPYPDYYWDFMESPHVLLLPQNDSPNILDPLPEPLQKVIHSCEQQKVIYSAPKGPVIKPVLHEQPIETSLDNSNLVGNVYFANYFSWQGQARDKYLYSLAPEYFRGTGESGELVCLESRVEHLREAMPFDSIIVSMALKELSGLSIVLFFEYFRVEAEGRRTKLAIGEQKAAWVARDKKGNPVPEPFPSKIMEDLEKKINSN